MASIIYQFSQSCLIHFIEDALSNRDLKEGLNVELILLQSLLEGRQLCPVASFQFMRKDVKLLIVSVLLKRSSSLEAINDKLQANLSISHTDSHILLIKGLEAFLPQLYPFLIQLLHVIFNTLLIKLKEVHVVRIEEPILHLSFDFYHKKAHPMISDPQHETNDQWFVSIIIPEVSHCTFQFQSTLVIHQQVFVLKLPSAREQLQMFKIPKYFKIFKEIQAKVII